MVAAIDVYLIRLSFWIAFSTLLLTIVSLTHMVNPLLIFRLYVGIEKIHMKATIKIILLLLSTNPSLTMSELQLKHVLLVF